MYITTICASYKDNYMADFSYYILRYNANTKAQKEKNLRQNNKKKERTKIEVGKK